MGNAIAPLQRKSTTFYIKPSHDRNRFQFRLSFLLKCIRPWVKTGEMISFTFIIYSCLFILCCVIAYNNDQLRIRQRLDHIIVARFHSKQTSKLQSKHGQHKTSYLLITSTPLPLFHRNCVHHLRKTLAVVYGIDKVSRLSINY